MNVYRKGKNKNKKRGPHKTSTSVCVNGLLDRLDPALQQKVWFDETQVMPLLVVWKLGVGDG